MGGASTAAPIDAGGSLMWNPAAISGLTSSEVDIGMELLLPTEKLSSSFPAFNLQGSTGGEPGVMPIPELAWVHKSADSPMAYGVGIFGIGGFATNYPASLTNPVLTPQPPNGVGLGRISSVAEYYQVVPTVSYTISEKLSVGLAPTLTIAKLDINPMVFAAPDDANGSGFFNYPTSDGTRYHFGGGFQVGVYYTPTETWSLGLCVKSPQWFETFTSNVTNELGQPESASVKFNYPMIVSLGTGFSGIDRWLFACDVRYFNYAGTDGFGTPAAFAPDGALLGLGWKNIFSVHTGAQYYFSDRLTLRAGYRVQSQSDRLRHGVFQRRIAADHRTHRVDWLFLSPDRTRDSLGRLSARLSEHGKRPDLEPGHWGDSRHDGRDAVSADGLAVGLTVQY